MGAGRLVRGRWLGGCLAGAVFGCLALASSAAAAPTFQNPAPDGSFTGTGTISVATGDINEDGNLDVLSGSSSGAPSVSLNRGPVPLSETAGDWPRATGGTGDVPALVVADLNGDDNLDWATANRTSNDVSVFLGDGAGGVLAAGGGVPASPTAYGVVGQPFALATGDFDEDDDVDLVVADQTSNAVRILANAGDGTFTSGTSVGSGGTRPRGLAVGDVDGNGDLDVVVTNSGSDTPGAGDDSAGVLLGDGTGGLGSATTYPVGDRPRRVVLGDFDGDSGIDIATANSGSALSTACPCADSISVLLNDSGTPGTFGTAVDFPTGSSTAPYDIGTADFDGDGDLDLATANRVGMLVGTDRAWSVLEGAGDGSFNSPTLVSYDPDEADAAITALEVADLDGDTRPDLISQNAACCVDWTLNTTPIAEDDDVTVDEDSSANPIDVLANDIDVTSVNSVDTTGTFGTVDIVPGGAGVEYTPDPGYCNDGPGTDLPADTFTYTGNGGTTATVSVTVTCDSAPDTFYVRTAGSGDACTQANPCATIEDALAAHAVAPQPGDVIDVGPGIFVGNVDAGLPEDEGLTIRGTLAGDSRQTTIRGEGAGVGGFGPAVYLGACGTAEVLLRDVNVDTESADSDVQAISLDGGSDLDNVHARNQLASDASGIVEVCQGGTTITDSTIDATTTSFTAGIVALDGLELTDSHIELDAGSGPGIVHASFPGATDPLEITRSWVQNGFGASNPAVISEGDLTLDSSLVTGGQIGVLHDNSFGSGGAWQIQSSTIDVGNPGTYDIGLADVFLPTADGDDPISVNVDSSILAEEIQSVPFGGGPPGPGQVTCTFSDVQLVLLDTSFTDDCDISGGNSQGNTTTDPAGQFVGGSPFDWSLLASAPALDTGQPGSIDPGLSTTDLAGNARRATGLAASCPNAIRDMGAYERLAIPCNTTLPSINNPASPQVGTKLGSNTGRWSGSPSAYTVRWIRCDADGVSNCTDATGDRTSGSYAPVPADAGHTLRVRWVATGGGGDSDSAMSAPTGVVTQPVPVNTQLPSIQNAASPIAGTKLGSNAGKWNGSPTSYKIRWIRCDADGVSNCTDFTGDRTSGTYTPVGADVGHTLRVRYVGTNAAGDGTPAISAPSGVVGAATPVNTTLPSIKNAASPTVGTKLGGEPGRWTGAPTSYRSKWIRCDADGTSNCVELTDFRDSGSYKPTAASIGHTLRVRFIATNAAGDSAPATSDPSGVVSP